MRFGIREKLFFLLLLVFGVLILATFWQIGVQAQRVSSETIVRSLQQSNSVLETKIESRFGSIGEVARSIAKDARVLPLIYDSEVLTLQDQSLEFQRQLDFDILFFTDGSGNVLARSDRPGAIGQNVAGRAPFFDSALAGTPGRGYFLSQGRLMQIVTEPIFDNVATDLVRGTVALAYEFSSEMANEIVSLTFSEVGFFSFARGNDRQATGVDSIYVTDEQLLSALNNFFSQSDTRWRSIFSSEDGVHSFQAVLDGQEYYAEARRIANQGSEPLGFVMILRSSRDLLAPFIEIQNSVLLTGTICLFFAFVFAGFLSFRISRPIIELVSVTGDIRDGRFPEKRTVSTGGDEIGTLYRSVVDMGNTLREKAELENYLAQISSELNTKTSLPIDDTVALLPEESPRVPRVLLQSDYESNSSEGSVGWVEPGSIIANRYEVIKLIGKGAVGEVFLVFDQDLEERVALKLLPRELFSADPTLNIKEEIRLARRITHRNVLRTFDRGHWTKYTYISMEYLHGFDLDHLIAKRGAQDLYITLLMGRQICSAMNAAHQEGVIHLDLKPANMMVNRQGILKIMDFGLARSIAGQKHTQEAKDNLRLMGTPRYMAPEQFLNDFLDERTDIYSIGIILYTLLTGAPPYSHKDYMKIAEMQVHQDLPEIQGTSGVVTGPLEDVIRKATEKNPSDRFQSVWEMLERLNEV